VLHQAENGVDKIIQLDNLERLVPAEMISNRFSYSTFRYF
jgi:hypothetical protein